ncbi:MAG: hypothetical protein GX757_04475 [Clostridiales bacterium]|nr:hypothetical protein [Clostridiales bacterium]
MKSLFYNMGYFIRELFKTIRLSALSNFFSFIGTSLILLLFGLILISWWIGDNLVSSLKDEAQISAYFSPGMEQEQMHKLVDEIASMDGVTTARYIDTEMAYEENKRLLGDEADILELFDDNPFESYIDIRINLDDMDSVISRVTSLQGIDYVRDNRDVLAQLKSLVNAIKLIGSVVALAVGITTIIIISHMIRQGIYNNREQINTLWLLGAPSWFIGFPFVLAGILLTLLGGFAAVGLIVLMLEKGYAQLSGYLMFLPFPSVSELKQNISYIIIVISAGLGLFGSLFGLSSIKKD